MKVRSLFQRSRRLDQHALFTSSELAPMFTRVRFEIGNELVKRFFHVHMSNFGPHFVVIIQNRRLVFACPGCILKRISDRSATSPGSAYGDSFGHIWEGGRRAHLYDVPFSISSRSLHIAWYVNSCNKGAHRSIDRSVINSTPRGRGGSVIGW